MFLNVLQDLEICARHVLWQVEHNVALLGMESLKLLTVKSFGDRECIETRLCNLQCGLKPRAMASRRHVLLTRMWQLKRIMISRMHTCYEFSEYSTWIRMELLIAVAATSRRELSSSSRTVESWVGILLEEWMSMGVYSVCVVPSLRTGLAMGCSPIQGGPTNCVYE
jgi:hypothetical protein